MKIKLKIISGSLKSRSIAISKNPQVRPMLSRARDTLFNTLYNLIDFENKIVLDICCGSGILAIEALSRGCETAYFFDIDRKICMELKKNLEILNLLAKSEVIQTNIFLIPKNKNEVAHFVFVDLPYKSSFLMKKVFKKLYLNNWVNDSTLFVIATDKQEKLPLNDVILIKEKIVSNTKLWFLKQSFVTESNLSV